MGENVRRRKIGRETEEWVKKERAESKSENKQLNKDFFLPNEIPNAYSTDSNHVHILCQTLHCLVHCNDCSLYHSTLGCFVHCSGLGSSEAMLRHFEYHFLFNVYHYFLLSLSNNNFLCIFLFNFHIYYQQ